MGRFDQIRCEYPLPDNPGERIQNAFFQTQDFSSELDTYVITRDGRLTLDGENRSYPSSASAELVPYTGAVNFYEYLDTIAHEVRDKYERQGLDYTSYQTAAERNSYWIAYNATFDKGMLVSIERDLADWPDPVIPTAEDRERIKRECGKSNSVMLDEAGSIPIHGLDPNKAS